jgi:hypothetical protein
MKLATITGFLCLAALGMAQQVQFDYDRTANFGDYKTYEWVESKGRATNQIMDQNIKRAVDGQLAGKGMRRVDSGGDVQIAYQAAVDHEKQFDTWGAGPRMWANARVTSSTIDVGKLAVDVFDPAKKQLVWRGMTEKTLDINKDPEKNYKTLEKVIAKLMKNYPPGSGK